MEKQYLYAYLEYSESGKEFIKEFIKIDKVDKIEINGEPRIFITYPDDTIKDVTYKLCMHGMFTEERAERTIKFYRKTGYWPGELPPEEEKTLFKDLD